MQVNKHVCKTWRVLITLLCHVSVHGPLSLASTTTKEMLMSDADTFRNNKTGIFFTFSIHS